MNSGTSSIPKNSAVDCNYVSLPGFECCALKMFWARAPQSISSNNGFAIEKQKYAGINCNGNVVYV